ncbi:MAG: hypothetical protein AVDCRST_MAG40-2977, partial [uncultured Gemmatimonadaceae bacterium]
ERLPVLRGIPRRRPPRERGQRDCREHDGRLVHPGRRDLLQGRLPRPRPPRAEQPGDHGAVQRGVPRQPLRPGGRAARPRRAPGALRVPRAPRL